MKEKGQLERHPRQLLRALVQKELYPFVLFRLVRKRETAFSPQKDDIENEAGLLEPTEVRLALYCKR